MTASSSNVSTFGDAQTALTAFAQSEQPGVWPHLNKADMVREMRSRLRHPYSVNQGPQPFCGPASVLFELIRKWPLRYVDLCRSLYETGGFQATGRSIQASEALRQASKNIPHMGPTDWMVLATLRESENLIFPVEPNAPEIIRNLAGMTKSWEMLGWVREILGYDHADYMHTYVLRDLTALRKAQQIIDQGGVAFGLITANSLLSKHPPRVTTPNHWVTLVGNIDIQKGRFGRHDSGQVSFDVFTWAKKVHIDVNEGVFEDGFWGVVLGW
ncbi:hypothetical protein IQ254_07265 [Nodosilinea sp. LEGE 07088]|uniref:hypothetical protein n=1 Tax=Nodosilinea sp. LEGE 07088 TaxID=2777968 RepID=UPI00187EF57B|nr:hypothetical protein [Nodosilinea sp. LEGE 07088]MBE9137003.1 hypothetical protein [Nodosilinea sp. LEGE 07088]